MRSQGNRLHRLLRLRASRTTSFSTELRFLGQTTGSGGCGIRIANAPDAGHVHFMHLDVEKTTSGIMMESGAGAQFLNPYFRAIADRGGGGIRIVPPGIRSLVVQGGVFRVNNHNSPAIHFCEGTYQ